MPAIAPSIHALLHLRDGVVLAIPKTAHMPATVHRWSQREIDALILAICAQRPLLIRGEPGTGKTQLARAAATVFRWELHAFTIHARIEASDLVYRFDAVKRLSDAQARKELDERDYWEPGPLWKAFGWEKACEYGSCRNRKNRPAPNGHLVLLDEIDKADSDVPNALLEVLGQRAFSIPQLQIEFGSSDADAQQPLILITTNEERELPSAFLRRCVVLNLEAGTDYCEWLLDRGKAHFAHRLDEDVMRHAAERLVHDRDEVKSAGLPPPGLAEYIDLLSALHRLAGDDLRQQNDWLRKLSGYAFVKHRRQEGFAIDQNRPFDRTLTTDPSAGS